ncbi:MAG: signal peptidase II [Spirochaetales bacterium]
MEIVSLKKFLPLILTFNIVLIDQITKLAILSHIPLKSIGASFFGDFLRIIHVRNPGIAFSIGKDLPDPFRTLLFTVFPFLILAGVGIHFFRNNQYTPFQRWMVAGILGGGVGNLIDRIFRPEGVIDFIDVKIYGFLGMERWPTFNIADSAVVVCGIGIACSLIFKGRTTHE